MSHSKLPTPEEVCRADTLKLIKKTLKGEYKPMIIESFSFQENYDESEVETKACVKLGGKRYTLDSTGVGVLDAAFKGFQHVFAKDYRSLAPITLKAFRVYTDLSATPSIESTKERVTVVIELVNSHGRVVPFRFSSLSLTKSLILCLSGAFEYYINSESCFRKLRALIAEANSRGRSEIAANYISNLVNIVGVSSYEEIL